MLAARPDLSRQSRCQWNSQNDANPEPPPPRLIRDRPPQSPDDPRTRRVLMRRHRRQPEAQWVLRQRPRLKPEWSAIPGGWRVAVAARRGAEVQPAGSSLAGRMRGAGAAAHPWPELMGRAADLAMPAPGLLERPCSQSFLADDADSCARPNCRECPLTWFSTSITRSNAVTAQTDSEPGPAPASACTAERAEAPVSLFERWRWPNCGAGRLSRDCRGADSRIRQPLGVPCQMRCARRRRRQQPADGGCVCLDSRRRRGPRGAGPPWVRSAAGQFACT